MLDCEPHNKKKQGVVHSIGRWAAGKLPEKGGIRKAAVEHVEHREKVSGARTEARREQDIRYAREREKLRTDARLKRASRYESQGGFFGNLGAAIAPRTVRVAGVKKRKKKGGKKRKASGRSQRITINVPRGMN